MAMTPVGADRDYPQMVAEANHVEPAPRRVRATLAGEQIFDTTRARYVWEWPYYPQYYIPAGDIDSRFLVDEDHDQHLRQGTARRHGLRAGGLDRPGTVRVFGEDGRRRAGRRPGSRVGVRLPTRQLLPIAGLVAFYNEKVDLDVDGQRLPRPRTHFFRDQPPAGEG
jgi:uncharacterized protein (DUF427 family)